MTEQTAAASHDLERGRACYEQRQWTAACAALLCAERSAPLALEDLERLAWSAALSANDKQFLATLERLHQACLQAAEKQRAARAAFWLGFRLSALGAPAQAAGWFARAAKLVEHDERCSERGYLLLATVYRHLGEGDDVVSEAAVAEAVAAQAAEIGESCQDRELIAWARSLQGQAMLYQGKIEPGLALLDEVMLAATAGELTPLVTGIVYCGVIATCRQTCALDRAREWTLALARWCEAQPELVTFTGICLVHRCEIAQLRGAWPEAIEELQRVCEGPLRDADPEALGEAYYQRAEILRLRGDWLEAEAAYRMASRHGHEAQPGIALLRLAQGQTEAAASASLRVLSTTKAIWQRARQLPACVEILLAAGKLDEARGACDELAAIARDFDTVILRAMAGHARGALCLAEGDHRGAIGPLREAFAVWREVGAPYIAARIRVLLGRAFIALGDRDSAELELDAARSVFEELGAAPELAALTAWTAAGAPAAPSHHHGLSRRELQVLRLVARGKTNKVIARELGVSERTVDRHVSNIFTKLGVPSRAAATALAYEYELV